MTHVLELKIGTTSVVSLEHSNPDFWSSFIINIMINDFPRAPGRGADGRSAQETLLTSIARMLLQMFW